MGRKILIVFFAALTLLAALSGCIDVCDKDVDNRTDRFSWGGDCAAYSQDEAYNWQCTSSGAKVSWSVEMASGSLSATISDAAGKVVYTKTFSSITDTYEEEYTSSGSSGEWRVQLDFSDCTGDISLNLRAETTSVL